jgi:hypothetical protein
MSRWKPGVPLENRSNCLTRGRQNLGKPEEGENSDLTCLGSRTFQKPGPESAESIYLCTVQKRTPAHRVQGEMQNSGMLKIKGLDAERKII